MTDADLKTIDAAAAQPLYIQLAQMLSERIATGAYAVGGLLPTEAELTEAYGVSRYTVRQAIQHLRQQGLVSARKGVGTRVEARSTDQSYSHSIQSLSELLQLAQETRLDLVDREEIEARGTLAEALGCRPRKRWVRIEGIRRGSQGEPPICHSEVYLDAVYKEIASDQSSLRTALWSLIETHYGETVIEVSQQIEACILNAKQAADLEAKPSSPALKFTRRYYVTGRRLVELSINLHPADRFSYHMNITRDATAR